MLYEKIRKLCKEKGVTVTEVERELGFGRGSLSKIASTEKKMSRLKELYLNELITLDDYKRDLAVYRADIETFKAEVRKYRGTDKKALYDLVGRNPADWYWTLNDDERKTIWRSVIDAIYCDGDKNVRVVFC